MNMRYYELDKEEKRLLKEVEAGQWKSVKNLKKELKRYKEIARNTLNKTKNLNIRVTQKVYMKLKAKSVEEGIPYQTLVSSILHKYVNGTL